MGLASSYIQPFLSFSSSNLTKPQNHSVLCDSWCDRRCREKEKNKTNGGGGWGKVIKDEGWSKKDEKEMGRERSKMREENEKDKK